MKKFILFFVGIFMLASCSKESNEDTVRTEGTVGVIDGISAELHTDKGSIGKVIDTRKIFRKGYTPTTAEINFQDFSQLDKILDINKISNLAMFELSNEALTDEQKTAFSEGVNTTITIKDETGAILNIHNDDNLVLNDSNIPLSLTTENIFIKRPINLKDGTPYLFKIDGNGAGVTSHCNYQTNPKGECWQQKEYIPADDFQRFYQQFHFVKVEIGLYKIIMPGITDEEIKWMGTEEFNGPTSLESTGVNEESASIFEFVQDEDGWSKLRLVNNQVDPLYLYFVDSVMRFELESVKQPSRIRLIADDIDWEVVDHGTTYNQPINAPAKLDFAYSATLLNCSSAILTEEVGKTETKTRITEISTTESFQIFSSTTETYGVSVELEVKAKIGADVKGVGEASEEITVKEGLTYENKYTTENTTTSENTWKKAVEFTTEVSRIRTLQIPQFTGVEVYDAIKRVENVTTHFVQKIRISGVYNQGVNKGIALSGSEIATQIQFNLFGGVMSNISNDFIEITIRGKAVMDQLYEATTNVDELPNFCDN